MTELEQAKQALADRTSELERVKRVANELAAQVEQLHESFNKATTWEDVRDAFKKTPAQCLAEVRANAAGGAIIAFGAALGSIGITYTQTRFFAEDYANQIRQQAKP